MNESHVATPRGFIVHRRVQVSLILLFRKYINIFTTLTRTRTAGSKRQLPRRVSRAVNRSVFTYVTVCSFQVTGMAEGSRVTAWSPH